MRPFLVAAVLVTSAGVLGAEDKPAAAPKVEGKWLIAYAEEGGRRNNAWEAQLATVSDNTLSFERDGKKSSLRLSFGPHQTVKASIAKEGGEEKGDYTGVYIAAQDYFAISLNQGDKADAGADRGSSSGAFILILKRQR
jgi:hypothetical protein